VQVDVHHLAKELLRLRVFHAALHQHTGVVEEDVQVTVLGLYLQGTFNWWVARPTRSKK
jgi:hypothetical protein